MPGNIVNIFLSIIFLCSEFFVLTHDIPLIFLNLSKTYSHFNKDKKGFINFINARGGNLIPKIGMTLELPFQGVLSKLNAAKL